MFPLLGNSCHVWQHRHGLRRLQRSRKGNSIPSVAPMSTPDYTDRGVYATGVGFMVGDQQWDSEKTAKE